MEEVVPKMVLGEAQMRDNPEKGELDAADDVCRHCKKNFSFVLACIDMRTIEGYDRDSEVETVHSRRDREGKGLFLQGN